VAEALAADMLDGAEPAVLAGVLSSVVFEPRRARRMATHGAGGHHRPPGRRGGARGAKRKEPLPDRLGEKRVVDLRWRCEALSEAAERIRLVEELHGVPRTRQPSAGLATAVTSWARGASFGTALGVASRDIGELAPGDFVRTMKSVADLVQQVAYAAAEPATAKAAREAVDLLLRGVVAGGLPTI